MANTAQLALASAAGAMDDVNIELTVASVSFEELYADQFLPMVKFASLMTGNVDVARDMVQDAFVQANSGAKQRSPRSCGVVPAPLAR